MRVGQVASKLGVSASLIRRLERQGKLPRPRRLRVGTRLERRYTPDDLREIEAVLYPPDQREGATPSPPLPAPAVELVPVELTRQYTVNGTPYGPGVVKVPAGLVSMLLEGESRAAEARA